jgi:hypothetical protein
MAVIPISEFIQSMDGKSVAPGKHGYGSMEFKTLKAKIFIFIKL